MSVLVCGIVRDGLGQGRDFTQLDWVRQQVCDKIGFDPYPGTLNLQVENPDTLAAFRKQRGIAIDPAPGFCSARCLRAQLAGRIAAAWILPDVPGYPSDVIELIAPVCLRETLGVGTGDVVEVEIEIGN